VHSFEVKTFMANADKAEVKSGVSGNGEMKRMRMRLRVSSRSTKEQEIGWTRAQFPFYNIFCFLWGWPKKES
jgi:hypothetical protein